MILEVKNLKKYFPVYSGIFRHKVGDVKAVEDLSFSLNEGEILGIVGESGSGKSTAARCCTRLIEPTAGSIHFMGTDLMKLDKKSLRSLRSSMQMVFQDPFASLNPRRSIKESLSDPLIYHKMFINDEKLHNYLVKVMQEIGLSEEALFRYPHEFSGGQQQRICIGRAIALRPKLLVLDEAVSALDVSIQSQILNLLYELKNTHGLSYLFISHDLNIIRHFCDRVLVMHRGRVVEEGDVATVFNSPKDPYTQSLLASILKLDPAH